MDLHRAGIEHLLWKRRIRSCLDEKKTVTKVDPVTHKECPLGFWLYSEGLQKFGSLNEFKELEITHVSMHMIANKIIRLKERNEVESAEEEYKKLELMSKEIVGKLTSLAIKIS